MSKLSSFSSFNTVVVSGVPALSADSGLLKYLREIRSFPILTLEEEFMLAKRLQEHGDVEAAHRLVVSHLRLVAKMAIGFRHYGLSMTDLIGEGNLGLMRAVKKFDPDKGFRLATYAIWWIKAALHEYVLASWSMVKIGTLAAHKKLFFNLRRVKAKLQILESGDLSPEDVKKIATELDVSEHEVDDMNQRMGSRDSSLNAMVTGEIDIERQDLLIDSSPNQEDILSDKQERKFENNLLKEGLKVLDQRELDIIIERRLKENPMTLEELGSRYKVSRERIRQLEARAFIKLQNAIHGLLPAPQTL